MTGFTPYKPRPGGGEYAPIVAAYQQVGGLEAAADILDRPLSWIKKSTDPDIDPDKACKLTWREVRQLTRLGVTAFAEHVALLGGGVFLPPAGGLAPGELQSALAKFSVESGQAVSELITRSADGVLCKTDGQALIPEIDDALRALMALRAMAVRAAESQP